MKRALLRRLGAGKGKTGWRWILVTAFFLGVAPWGLALDPGKAFSQYLQMDWNYESGLSQKNVNAIAQTGDGFLWLATEEGLVRYDGKSFVTYDERNTPVLGDRLIRSLAATPEGGLWIGTMTGLVRYEDGTFTSYRNESRWHQDIFDLATTTDGSVWFSSSSGLRRLIPGEHGSPSEARLYTTSDGLPSNGITGVAGAPDGSLWIGTRDGLAHYSSGRFSVYGGRSAGRAKAEEIVSMARGRSNDVWLGNADGSVDHWSRGHLLGAWEGAETRGHSVVSLAEDSDGTVWVAFRKLGLGRLRNGKLELLTRADGLPSIDPDWIFEDRERNLWVGWADDGLSMFRDGKFSIFGRAEGLSSDVISSVFEEKSGDLLVGMQDAGVMRLTDSEHLTDRAKNQMFSRVRGASDAGAMALLEQRDGTLWVGSDRGSVTRIIRGHSTSFQVPGKLTPGLPSMVEDGAGDIWFGFDMPNGLARLRGNKFEFVQLPGAVKALAIGQDGSLWIASYLGGLIRYQDGKLKAYTERDGLPNLFLTSVYVDPEGTVWAGSYLGGLIRFRDEKITVYSVKQGLSDSTVGAEIADGHGSLWLAGTRGIMRISLQQLSDYAAGERAGVETQTFGYSAGLRSDECNFKAHPAALRDRLGRLWFTTLSGLAMIDPGRIRPDPVAARGLIDGIVAGKRNISSTKTDFQVRPGESSLFIRFTAPTFAAPQQVRLRYRLTGLQDEWSQGEANRGASFANLAPGHYRFELQVIQSDGVPGETTSLRFDVLPHFYETWWFRSLALLTLAFAVWLGFRLRTLYLLRNTKRLESLVVEKTSEVRLALNEAESARDQMRDQAMRDFLTGMWNRRAIFEILEKELARCGREDRPLAILMADIDHFKKINDTWGHQIGDQVICEVSRRIRQNIRSEDAVGRYGGEEMLVLLPDCPLDQSIMRAETLRISISSTPYQGEGFSVPVSCSFGLAHIHPGATSGKIVGDADAALYEAKRDGRNCVRLVSPERVLA